MNIDEELRAVGLDPVALSEGDLPVHTPIDGSEIARVIHTGQDAARAAIDDAEAAFLAWRSVPAPRRGELVRSFADELRAHKSALGRLVTIETGKILAEGEGEVQEMIDICDFGVGLSRQLYGLTIASERPGHRMMEQWHPLGPIGVITAFNFPVAVWSWNFALATVCGDPVVWKPSEKTPLTALACQALFERVRRRFGADAPGGLLRILIGGRETGERLARAQRLRLISATGSTRMGQELAPVVAARFGRTLLELGGNNGMIVTPSADLDLAERAIVFSAVGTAGQRCTSLRRLIVHDDIHDTLVARLRAAYASLPIGNPLDAETLVGPMIDGAAHEHMQAAMVEATADGGSVFGGEGVLEQRFPDAHYVRPAIITMPAQTDVVRRETFAPILYVLRYRELDQAIALHNGVSQGLASSIFTNDMREAERFLSVEGSDCGIVNVNIGPSGAEIGGAFGGEKDTGGGRESGSDAWKAYMRRATNTINYSTDLPLAQGLRFGGSA
ncbi:MAG: aldehyde dehydrogenase family protein [Rhodospirillales bacterium]|nr:aldehyde dehydrogenase family protein [Rhodospirillales bacterium]